MKREKEILLSYEGRLNDKKNEAKALLLRDAPKLLMSDNFMNAGNYLDQIVSNQESIVPIEALELSIRDNVCACCNNDLNTHISNLNHVKTLRENYKRSIIGTFTGSIKSMINDAQNQYDATKESVQELL